VLPILAEVAFDPMSAHFPVIKARPRSVTRKVCPDKMPCVHVKVKTGNPEMSRAGGVLEPVSATPMFRGAATEWLPTFGVS
jgi:hypothetical protein